MIKRLAFILLMVGAVSVTYSQEFSSRVWHTGWMVTVEGDTLRGELKYDMEANSIQVMREDRIYTFSSKKIMYVEFFDSVLKNYRQFYSIPYNVSYDYRAPILFEVLYEGPTTLLSREKIVIEMDPYSQSYYYTGPGSSRESVSRTYYFAFKSGEIKMYTGKKGEIFTLLPEHGDALKSYIKKNRLDLNDVRDLIRVMAFYNSI
ncbi:MULTISPECIES: hypothetical protein [Reichenbachiella]|uniref:Uncharacterized protein n=1 Tax=Reichenbachiella agariperforans TaxID=156994 RepID=A0A1M6SV73_REIAG|nr:MULTISPECIES: hypothetical protein [Reichenbachiella]MBU2916286.1 hypothetical protein [Reichenbachiella agariperforans]RJE75132.1 hypothetical protein BGP76_18660 [Reichenbachiella sp. MSK19-1]SHK48547.1 hypothetical protein SAMN04488028_105166 [Reichenbachiella agariperforans]